MQDNVSDILTRDLQPLLAVLRQEGFSIGVDTALNVEILVRSVAMSGRGLSEPVDLASVLAPIVCKNVVEQERFGRIYAAWTRSEEPGERQQATSKEKVTRAALAVDRVGTETVERTEGKSRRLFWVLIAVVAGVFAMLAASMLAPIQMVEMVEIMEQV